MTTPAAGGGPGGRWRVPRVVRLAELVVPRRPAPWTVGGLGVLCGVLTSLFVVTLDDEIAPGPAIAWTTSALCGAVAFALAVNAVAIVLRNEPFGTPRWTLVAKLYGGYAAAGAAAAAVEDVVRHALVLPVREDAAAFVAHAGWFWLVALGANAFATLRWRVSVQDVVLRERGRDLDRTRALLAQADEHVRRDAAEVLHGRVQSRLLALEVRLERAAAQVPPGSALQGELTEVSAVLEDLRVNDIRLTSHQLHPPAVRISLLSALRSLAASFAGNFGVDVDVVASPDVVAIDDPTAAVLDEPTRLVLYRALEEALQNAYRHGRATTVTAELSLAAGGGISLVVRDDGAGFDPSSFTAGFGTASIAARVDDAGGTWSLASTPGGGATLVVTLPLAPPTRS